METYTLIPSTLSFSTRLDDGSNEILHNHSYFELLYIKTGAINHSVMNSVQKLAAGDAYLICPGTPHRFTHEKGTCTRRDVLIGNELMRLSCDFIDKKFYDSIVERKAVKFKLSDEEISFFERRFALFLSDANSDISRKNYEKVIVVQLLGGIYMEEQKSIGNSLDFRNRCLLSINNHYVHPRAIDFVYSESGYNRIYFSKKFKQEFGTTLTEYILSLRLNHAAYLLQTTSNSIEECCHAIGLESVSYFINTFKDKYGVTPAKYRTSVRF